MSIVHTCKKCTFEMRVPERYFGRTLKCQGIGAQARGNCGNFGKMSNHLLGSYPT